MYTTTVPMKLAGEDSEAWGGGGERRQTRGGAWVRILWQVLVVLILLSTETMGAGLSQEEVEKQWVESLGGVVGQEEAGEEEYYLYYYEGEEGEEREESRPVAESRAETRESASPFDFHQLSKLSSDRFISEAKKFCNCTTREETLASFDHVPTPPCDSL